MDGNWRLCWVSWNITLGYSLRVGTHKSEYLLTGQLYSWFSTVAGRLFQRTPLPSSITCLVVHVCELILRQSQTADSMNCEHLMSTALPQNSWCGARLHDCRPKGQHAEQKVSDNYLMDLISDWRHGWRPKGQHARPDRGTKCDGRCKLGCRPKGPLGQQAIVGKCKLDCIPKGLCGPLGQQAERTHGAHNGEPGHQGFQGQPRQGGDCEMHDPLLRRLKGQGFRTDDGECCGQEPGIRTILLGLMSTHGDMLQSKPVESENESTCCTANLGQVPRLNWKMHCLNHLGSAGGRELIGQGPVLSRDLPSLLLNLGTQQSRCHYGALVDGAMDLSSLRGSPDAVMPVTCAQT